MRQNFAYLQLKLAYYSHYIKERQAKRIVLLRIKQSFIKSLSTYDIFNACIKKFVILVCQNHLS